MSPGSPGQRAKPALPLFASDTPGERCRLLRERAVFFQTRPQLPAVKVTPCFNSAIALVESAFPVRVVAHFAAGDSLENRLVAGSVIRASLRVSHDVILPCCIDSFFPPIVKATTKDRLRPQAHISEAPLPVTGSYAFERSVIDLVYGISGS
jgi:hypothetical protein